MHLRFAVNLEHKLRKAFLMVFIPSLTAICIVCIFKLHVPVKPLQTLKGSILCEEHEIFLKVTILGHVDWRTTLVLSHDSHRVR